MVQFIMTIDITALPEDVITLKEIIKGVIIEKDRTINFLESNVKKLEEQLRLLNAKLFGIKSEKLTQEQSNQLDLFNEAEEIESAPEVITIPEHKRIKGGRRHLPADLPRIEKIYDISEEEKICACGSRLSRIGSDVSEKLDIVPAKIQVICNIRHKYACKNCEGLESEGGAVKIAALPPQIIPQGIATAGLIAYILTAKFVDSLPFYRQEKIFERMGVELSRATMANWAIHVATRCKPLIELLDEEIRSGPLINIDETTIQVMNEPKKDNHSKSYMWVFRGGNIKSPSLIYQYHSTRSGDILKEYLPKYSGYVQSDGYSGYNVLEINGRIILVGCFAHCRRKFIEVINARPKGKKGGSAEIGLNYISKLYAIERKADKLSLDYNERYKLRQDEAKPVLDEFRAWLEKRSIETPPTGLLGKAISYALNQWDRLIRYIDDGRLRPDNNLAENAIRPFVVGRKNWLFSGHPRGANASAALYSLIETAKANNIEPYRYLRYIFEQIPYAQTEYDYKKLLPQYLDREALIGIT